MEKKRVFYKGGKRSRQVGEVGLCLMGGTDLLFPLFGDGTKKVLAPEIKFVAVGNERADIPFRLLEIDGVETFL